MHTASMPSEHQPNAANTAAGSWDWPLPAGQATVLPDAPAQRWLAVNAGRVWLTSLSQRRQAQDIWLDAGERHPLPPGTAWVLEGWPQASVSVLLAAPEAAPQ